MLSLLTNVQNNGAAKKKKKKAKQYKVVHSSVGRTLTFQI